MLALFYHYIKPYRLITRALLEFVLYSVVVHNILRPQTTAVRAEKHRHSSTENHTKVKVYISIYPTRQYYTTKRNGVAGPAEPSITATGDRPRLVSVAQLVRHAGRVSLAIVVVVVEYY